MAALTTLAGSSQLTADAAARLATRSRCAQQAAAGASFSLPAVGVTVSLSPKAASTVGSLNGAITGIAGSVTSVAGNVARLSSQGAQLVATTVDGVSDAVGSAVDYGALALLLGGAVIGASA